MLNLEQVKKLLNDPAISDEEALEIRDQFYSLAEIIFEQWQKEKEREKLQRDNPKDMQSR
jgi:hypothetical protein